MTFSYELEIELRNRNYCIYNSNYFLRELLTCFMFDTNETDYAYSATVFLRQNPIKKRKSSLPSV